MCDSSANRRWACSNPAVLSFKESGTQRCAVAPPAHQRADSLCLNPSRGSAGQLDRNYVELAPNRDSCRSSTRANSVWKPCWAAALGRASLRGAHLGWSQRWTFPTTAPARSGTERGRDAALRPTPVNFDAHSPLVSCAA